MPTNVGERLRQAREELQKREGEKRPNRAKFARELRITPVSLLQIENGQSGKPSSETLLKLRDRGINPDYIMRGKKPVLVDHVERHLNKQTMLGIMDELDEDEQRALIDIANKIVGRKMPTHGKRPLPGYPEDGEER